jgi:tRNA 2-(methylsulfanyl)-N6-isopentenyladenosine37 hydroxylase
MNTLLHLQLPTDPRWASVAEKNIEDILVDHAYCEQKAASTCIALIINYSDYPSIVNTLTPIVAEEWGHFERVLEKLHQRGFELGKMRKDEYVNQLIKHIRKRESRERQLVDKLLICALIEARSCERFKLLWQQLQEEDLQKFYYELMVSEAGHYTTFITLAREVLPREIVDKRWQKLLQIEADIIASLGLRDDRIH